METNIHHLVCTGIAVYRRIIVAHPKKKKKERKKMQIFYTNKYIYKIIFVVLVTNLTN